MAKVIIVGDGPGGLSAALFLSKNGHAVTVYGEDNTAMHHAYLYNYLGFPEISGSELQRIGREQVQSFGTLVRHEKVTSIGAAPGGGFTVTTEEGEEDRGDYLILSEGRKPELAVSLGLVDDEGGIAVDRSGRTSRGGVYVIGRSARPSRSQAIISAGDGAAAALDILAAEAGKDVQDWDTPPKDDEE